LAVADWAKPPFEYADIIDAAPLPERLAALLKQLQEAPDGPASSRLKRARPQLRKRKDVPDKIKSAE